MLRSLLVASLLSLLALSPAAAAAQEGPAGRYLKQQHDRVSAIMRRSATTDADRARRTQEVTQILDDLLDYQELARRSLGAHWESHSEAERTQFVDLLRQLVDRQYQRDLERILDFDVVYVSEEDIDGGRK